MASTLVKINIHLVFHVKSTGVRIREEDLERVFSYLGGVIRGIGGSPVQVGGMPDHIHILSSLPKTLSLADFVRTIKADSSKWIKALDDCYQSFAWQEGYGAFSVSASQMKTQSVISWGRPSITRSGRLSRKTNSSWRLMVLTMMRCLHLGIEFILSPLWGSYQY